MKKKPISRLVVGAALAAFLSFTLPGCSQPNPEEGARDSSASATTATTTPGSSSSVPSPRASGDPLDNGGHAEYTWDDYVKAKRKMSGLKSWPQVDRIRFIKEEETAKVRSDCLTNAGFPTTVNSDGSWTTNNSSDQEEAFALANYTCEIQYPKELRYAQALTRKQFRSIFAYYRDSLVPCLKDRGYEIASQPSEETFVEAAVSGSEAWSPYDSVDTSSSDSVEIDSLTKDCPPMPSNEVLYGG